MSILPATSLHIPSGPAGRHAAHRPSRANLVQTAARAPFALLAFALLHLLFPLPAGANAAAPAPAPTPTPANASANREPPKPNIVLIVADDLGCDEVGVYGSKAVKTPGIDRLAHEGLRFDAAFVTASSCSPSRCSIITGRYPHATGAAWLHQPLPKEQVTFVEKLRAAGYWTAAAGKWHLGPNVRDRFDVVHEGDVKSDGAKADGSGCTWWLPTLEERPKDKPFFLWLAAFDPHRPYFPDAIPQPHAPAAAEVPPYLPDHPDTRADLALYYDEIARLDSYVGRVLDALDRQGVLDRTAVFFITDNGRPFPRCKTTVYDSGLRTPLLVRWPERIRSGGVCPHLVSTVDLAPTFLDIAGLRQPASFQGKSFAPLLLKPDGAATRQMIFAEHNWHDYAAFERAIRTTRYKYIRNSWPDLTASPPADAVGSPTFQAMRRLQAEGLLTPEQAAPFVAPRPAEEFYDLTSDPNELRNLAADPAQAKIVGRLRTMLEQWRRETGDTEPEQRPPDLFDRATGEKLPAARGKNSPDPKLAPAAPASGASRSRYFLPLY